MTLHQLVKFWYRVRLWKVSSHVEETYDGPPSETITVDITTPAISGGTTYVSERGVAGVTNTYEATDFFDSITEAGAAKNVDLDAGVYDSGDEGVGTPDFNATPNFTSAELNGLYSFSSTAYELEFLSYQALTSLVLCGGLYYPHIDFRTSMGFVTGDVYYRGLCSVKQGDVIADGISYLSIDLTLTFGGETFTLPAYYPDWGGEGYSDFEASGSIEAQKYWPYKAAAGTALYDEDTGELV
jgi:hypothetical protein